MIFVSDSQVTHLGDDASQNAAFFNQQLTMIVERMFMVKHKALLFREMFNINNEGGPGITSIQMTVWDVRGTAKLIGQYADDLPSSGAGAAIVTVPVRWIGDSFHTTWMELQQAQQAGTNLNDMRAMAANRGIEVKLNNIMFGVDQEASDAGIYGLLNNPNIPDAPVVAGASGSQAWKDKTPNEILADVNGGFTAISETTYNQHIPTDLSLPIEQYNLLVNTRLNDLSDKSIMTWLVENSPYLASSDNIHQQFELDGAGPGGSDVFYIYQSDDEVSEGYIPYEKNTPVGSLQDGLAYKTPVVASTAGLDVRYPLAYYRGSGI